MATTNTFLTALTNRGPLRIKFAVNRKGQRVAYRWARIAGRYIRISVEQAEAMIATGQAVRS